MNCAPWPEGKNTNKASGAASRTFCNTGAKSGLRSGVRSLSTMVPPLSKKRSTKNFSASLPGPKSLTSVMAFLILFLAAHSAMPMVAWGSVKLVRMM